MTYYITETTEYGTRITTSEDPIVALHYVLIASKDRLIDLDSYLFPSIKDDKRILSNMISLCSRIYKMEDTTDVIREHLNWNPQTLKEELDKHLNGYDLENEKAGYYITYSVDPNGHYSFRATIQNDNTNYQCQLTHQDNLEILTELFI